MTLDRRQFLAGAAGASGSLLAACASPTAMPPAASAAALAASGPVALPFFIGQPGQALMQRGSAPRVVASYWLTFRTSLMAAAINAGGASPVSACGSCGARSRRAGGCSSMGTLASRGCMCARRMKWS